MNSSQASFYVVGGTLKRDDPSYVQRQADHDLYEGVGRGKFCYVLTSRQMGKSSLMVRTAVRLRAEGVAVAVLDLTAIGQNLTAEQWYDGLLSRVGQQLDLEDELESFWQANERLGPLQRWMHAIREVVLPKQKGRIVIFVDEIDAVRSLPFSTDEFFAGVREFYNRRSEDPDLNRLTFCLLGVATPSDLIRDVRTTPFNVGQRIELTDFTEPEAGPLAEGFVHANGAGMALIKRVLYWTGGHPYLTQRLCYAVAKDESVTGPAGVDRICENLFLSTRARESDDNLLFVRERMLRSEADRASLLDLYTKVRQNKRIPDDETNPLVHVLRLSGLARALEGYLYVRNRIYFRVFDRNWIVANMPDAEVRRQRAAYRKGLLRAAAIAAGIVVVMGILSLYAFTQKREADNQRDRAEQTAQKLEAALIAAREQGYIAQDKSRLADEQKLEAQKQRAEADKQAKIAEDKGRQALEQQKVAEQQRFEAVKQKELAQSNLKKFEDSQSITQSLFYAARLNLAEQLWDRGSAGRVTRLLEEDQGSERRGFEWYYLWRRNHSYSRDWKQETAVSAVGYSPDGRTIATASQDETQLWDASSGALIRTLKTGQGRTHAIAFSPDGKFLAAAGETLHVSLWEVSSGREVLSLKGHKQGIRSLAFSSDGKTLATGSEDKTVKLWSVKTGQELAMLVAHKDEVLTVAFSSEGLLATGSRDKSVLIWDPRAQGPTAIRSFAAAVTSIAFSSEGLLATASDDKKLRLWSLKNLKTPVATKELSESVTSVAFSADGDKLAAGSADNTIALWQVYDKHDRSIKRLRAHASKSSLMTPGLSQEEFEVVEPLTSLGKLRGHDGPILGVAFSPDGETLVTGSLDKTAKLWNLDNVKDTVILEDEVIQAVAFAPTNNMAALLSKSKLMVTTLMLFNPSNGALVTTNAETTEATGSATCLDFSPTVVGLLATGSSDGKVRLLDIGKESKITVRKTIDAHNGIVTSLAFSPDGKTLVSVGSDGAAHMWNVASGDSVQEWREGVDNLNCVAFSHNGGMVAGGALNGGVYLWTVTNTGQSSMRLIKLERSVNALAFSPDGRLLAAGTDDNTVRILEVATQKERTMLEWHTLPVTRLAFSPDGKRLATASKDRTVRLWDTSTWQELAVLRDHDAPVLSIAFSRDGQSLISGGGDGARLWRAPVELSNTSPSTLKNQSKKGVSK